MCPSQMGLLFQQPLSAAHTYEVALAAPMARFERAGCAEDCGEAFGPMHAVPPAHLLGPLGRQLTDTRLKHRSLTHLPPWAGRDGKGRSGSKGGQGCGRGTASRCCCSTDQHRCAMRNIKALYADRVIDPWTGNDPGRSADAGRRWLTLTLPSELGSDRL
jgi:hypothetical protein